MWRARGTFRIAAGAFAAALANCAVEHMPKLDQVFGEVARVLRPGGKFILSVPTDQLNKNLAVAAALDRVGAKGQAARYREWFKTHAGALSHVLARRMAAASGIARLQESRSGAGISRRARRSIWNWGTITACRICSRAK